MTNAAALYYSVIGGGVNAVAQETELEHAPDGWQEQTIGFTRNTFYSSVFRSFTIPLRFAKQGAQILRDRLYRYGVEDIVKLVIKRLNFTTGLYDLFYSGEADLSKFNDDQNFFDVNCAEGGIMKYIKAYEGTDYEIDLTGDGVVDVEMDGLDLSKRYTFAIVDGQTNRGTHTVGCVYVSEEGTSFGVVTGSSIMDDVADFDPTIDDQLWLLKCIEGPVTFTVTGTIHLYINSISQNYHLYLLKNDGVTVIDLIPDQLLTVGNHTFNINVRFTLNIGEKAFIEAQKTEDFGDSSKYVQYSNDSLFFNFVTHFKTTNVKAINAWELGNRLLQKMCADGYTLESELLENCGIYLTSGDALRGLAGAKIKTSWKAFFQSFIRNENIGMKVSGTVATIGVKTDGFTNDIIYNLGRVKNAKFSFAEDFMFNTIKIGYPNQNYDDVNGKDEFNCTHQYTTPITRVSKELDLTGPYRADCYGIELLRINLENKTTVDSSSDNDTFMLDVLPGEPVYILNRPAYSSITGVINPDTIFNTRLSPHRLLIYKHGSALRSSLWKFDASNLSFQTTEKNSLLKTILAGVTVQENANVVISTLDAPFFIPIKVEFETQVPEALASIMATYGNGKFQFEYLGETFQGYCLDAKQKPSGNEAQTWSLLLTADNNMEALIHG
ncbi:MAG TPA: hypothetical protein PLD84_12765 [Chitinophagales bacterium]|nr:hypothetical protein [Chitinophagales bacterium]